MSRLLTFTITSNNVLAHLPVIELKEQRILLAFISCSMDNKPLGLVLERCPNTSSAVPLYDVGLDDPHGPGTFRIVAIDNVSDEGANMGEIKFSWREIHIRGRHMHNPSQELPRVPMNRDLSSFYLSRSLLKKFGGRSLRGESGQSAEQVASTPGREDSFPSVGTAAASENGTMQLAPSVGASLGKQSLPATFLFFAEDEPRGLPFLVHFGRCTVMNGESGEHWAYVEKYEGGDADTVECRTSTPVHACPQDHISGWQHHRRTFPIRFQPITHGIRLSFSEAFGTTKVLVPDIETVYQR